MNTDVVIDSINGQMDSIARLMSLIFVINVVPIYAVFSGHSEVQWGPLKVSIKHVARLILFLNIVLIGGVLIAMVRLAGLLDHLPPGSDAAVKGVTTVVSHPSILNPYVFSGDQNLLLVVVDYLTIFGFWCLIFFTLMASAYTMKVEGLLARWNWRLAYSVLPGIVLIPLFFANASVFTAINDLNTERSDELFRFMIRYLFSPVYASLIGLAIVYLFVPRTSMTGSPDKDKGQA
jgi:hypothetical protein